jgi:hypothetical protein
MGDKNMEIVELKCKNCGKNVYLLEEFAREKIFCTLGCLSEFEYKEGI